jgi:hypothetical protein
MLEANESKPEVPIICLQTFILNKSTKENFDPIIEEKLIN